jgi:hypothetical protein
VELRVAKEEVVFGGILGVVCLAVRMTGLVNSSSYLDLDQVPGRLPSPSPLHLLGSPQEANSLIQHFPLQRWSPKRATVHSEGEVTIAGKGEMRANA